MAHILTLLSEPLGLLSSCLDISDKVIDLSEYNNHFTSEELRQNLRTQLGDVERKAIKRLKPAIEIIRDRESKRDMDSGDMSDDVLYLCYEILNDFESQTSIKEHRFMNNNNHLYVTDLLNTMRIYKDKYKGNTIVD